MKLYCFPYAGSSAEFYASWKSLTQLELVPVQLPGRSIRRDERLKDIDSLVDDCVSRFTFTPPFALFGHSMGGFIAYELALKLQQLGHGPECLFISGRQPPSVPSSPKNYYLLSDDELIITLSRLGGLPIELLQNREYMDFILPTLRQDLRFCDDYCEKISFSSVSCPLFAFGGTSDPYVPLDLLSQWTKHTTKDFQMRIYDGDHFFLRQYAPSILQQIEKTLSSLCC